MQLRDRLRVPLLLLLAEWYMKYRKDGLCIPKL